MPPGIWFADRATPATGSVSSSIVNCNTPLVPGSHPCLAIPIDSIQCISADNTGFQSSGLTPNCSWFEGGNIWSRQVPASGNLSSDPGSIDDTGIAVWTGDDCNDLHIIGCDDDGGAVYLSFLLYMTWFRDRPFIYKPGNGVVAVALLKFVSPTWVL